MYLKHTSVMEITINNDTTNTQTQDGFFSALTRPGIECEFTVARFDILINQIPYYFVA